MALFLQKKNHGESVLLVAFIDSHIFNQLTLNILTTNSISFILARGFVLPVPPLLVMPVAVVTNSRLILVLPRTRSSVTPSMRKLVLGELSLV